MAPRTWMILLWAVLRKAEATADAGSSPRGGADGVSDRLRGSQQPRQGYGQQVQQPQQDQKSGGQDTDFAKYLDLGGQNYASDIPVWGSYVEMYAGDGDGAPAQSEAGGAPGSAVNATQPADSGGFQKWMGKYLPHEDSEVVGAWTASQSDATATMTDSFQSGPDGYGQYVDTYSAMAGKHPAEAQSYGDHSADQMQGWQDAMKTTNQKYMGGSDATTDKSQGSPNQGEVQPRVQQRPAAIPSSQAEKSNGVILVEEKAAPAAPATMTDSFQSGPDGYGQYMDTYTAMAGKLPAEAQSYMATYDASTAKSQATTPDHSAEDGVQPQVQQRPAAIPPAQRGNKQGENEREKSSMILAEEEAAPVSQRPRLPAAPAMLMAVGGLLTPPALAFVSGFLFAPRMLGRVHRQPLLG